MDDDAPMIIKQPYVVMFKPEGVDRIITHIYMGDPNVGVREFGTLAADLVRHVAKAFEVDEEDVWKVVDQERVYPTSLPREVS